MEREREGEDVVPCQLHVITIYPISVEIFHSAKAAAATTKAAKKDVPGFRVLFIKQVKLEMLPHDTFS